MQSETPHRPTARPAPPARLLSHERDYPTNLRTGSHAGFVALWLAYFTQRDVLEVRPVVARVSASFRSMLNDSIVWTDHTVLVHSSLVVLRLP